mmetsp:Transcript_575/g.2263  ORF Transcript_575/g.2263 Transcript_575/m.2263 type:complete len:137 (+) Transcript_575:73-483(+)
MRSLLVACVVVVVLPLCRTTVPTSREGESQTGSDDTRRRATREVTHDTRAYDAPEAEALSEAPVVADRRSSSSSSSERPPLPPHRLRRDGAVVTGPWRPKRHAIEHRERKYKGWMREALRSRDRDDAGASSETRPQ